VDLTDQQWAAVEQLLPQPQVREDGRGRPWRDPRDVLNGILWILRTGAPWADMPDRYPPYSTCFRRFQSWVDDGVLQHVLQALADDLVEPWSNAAS
jgi:transposase